MSRQDYDYLVHLVSCGLSGTQPQEKPDDVSFENVLAYGKRHEVANVAYSAVTKLTDKPEDAVMQDWTSCYYLAIWRDEQQARMRRELVDALSAAGIRTLEVQGTVVKRLYARSEDRMMSDIDLILDLPELEHAGEVLRGIGYQTRREGDREIDACKQKRSVELHTEFFSKGFLGYGMMGEPFEFAHPTGDGLAHELDDTHFYLYHLIHALKHFCEHGAGIRRVMDLHVVSREMEGRADMEYIRSVLRENRLEEKFDELMSLARTWFGGEETAADLSELIADVYSAGNHGNNDQYIRHKYQRERTQGKKFIKLRHFVSLIFPDKQYVYKLYPVCEKRGYPLVICWVYRWFSGVFDPARRQRFRRLLGKMRRN